MKLYFDRQEFRAETGRFIIAIEPGGEPYCICRLLGVNVTAHGRQAVVYLGWKKQSYTILEGSSIDFELGPATVRITLDEVVQSRAKISVFGRVADKHKLDVRKLHARRPPEFEAR